MKLISCHIENFGKFHDIDFEFEKGINSFCYENGWGKSTLAAFLRVMFYGFNNQGKRDAIENERKFYEPWQGGPYGGTLIFETDGKSYEITRSFSKKPKDDVFELRRADTNILVSDYSENIGQELFNLDSDAFMKTIFISQSSCETSVNASIEANLETMAEDTEDISNSDEMMSKLHDKLNAMSPSRKTGSLYKKKENIEHLKHQLARETGLREEIDEINASIEGCDEKAAELSRVKEVVMSKLRKQKDGMGSSDEERVSPSRKKVIAMVFIFLAVFLFCVAVFGFLQGNIMEAGIGAVAAIALLLVAIALLITSGSSRTRGQSNTRGKSSGEKSSGTESFYQLTEKLERIMTAQNTNDKNRMSYETMLKEKSRQLNDLLEIKQLLGIAVKEYGEELHKYKILVNVQKFMIEAKQNFTSKNREPLMKAFGKYYEAITCHDAAAFHIDAEANLTVKNFGLQRDIRTLSSGNKDLVWLCMRLALIEVMYGDEKPFVIFDDPFAFLDDENSKGALKLLEKIAKEYQVIYFTCTEKRSL